MKVSAKKRTLSPTLGWLTNSLEHEIARLSRLEAMARRRSEKTYEPYASYCARLADAYEVASVNFKNALRDVEVADELAREAKP